jgi:flagellar biosynthetic protein FliP
MQDFAWIAFPYMLLRSLEKYVASHYAFRWRQAMTLHYLPRWQNTSVDVEGASQRIQEDCMRFARQTEDIGLGVVRAVMTLISLAPSIILLMTCFSRIVIVLSFVRNALTLQGAPANQVIIGLSLFLTYFIMEPVWSKVQTNALQPYMEKKITSAQAVDEASKPIRAFMLRQTRPKDVELFVELAKIPPTTPEALPLRVVIPAYIISELRTAFQMGFLIFVPFILIDIVVATVLMSMGMMMMPPATIALPLKILLFVLVDGWSLIVRSLLMSFGV